MVRVVSHGSGSRHELGERQGQQVPVEQVRPRHGGTLSSGPMAHAVSVEEVTGGKGLVRFTELPQVLDGDDPRFAWPVVAWERYRLDPHRQPLFERGDGAYLLARLGGRPAGRVTAHVAEPGGPGCFGFWWAVDDVDVAAALVDAAAGWLRSQGCSTMTGPLSFTPEDEMGVQVAGFDAPGLTGRPWHPPHLARLLEDLGFEPVAERATWRLSTTPEGPELPLAADGPGHAGPYGDPRLVLDGIAAVPDVSGALRATGLRSAWSLARRARERAWVTCTVVRSSAEPEVAVPALQAAAGHAGYEWVVAPWSPDPSAEPEAVHRTYGKAL